MWLGNSAISTSAKRSTQVAKPPKDGWQVSGSLFIQDTSKKVKLLADFTTSRYGAGMYTAQLSLGVIPAGSNPDVTATLIWKVEGAQITRKVSVGNGVSVSGQAQGVEIVLEDTTVFTSVPLVGAEYEVIAQVAPGVRAGRAFSPILRGVANGVVPNTRLWPKVVAAGGTVQFLVPLEAGVIAVNPEIVADTFGTVLDPYKVIATQRDAFGNVLKAWYPLIEFSFVPLIPAAVEVIITNQMAAADIRVSLQWGIDG